MMLRNLVRAVVPVAGPAAALVAALVATPVQAQAALPPGLEPVPPETWTAEMLLGAEVRDLAADEAE